MAFTRHGHHIPGTVLDERPTRVARCGGVLLCTLCRTDVGVFNFNNQKVLEEEKDNHERNACQIE